MVITRPLILQVATYAHGHENVYKTQYYVLSQSLGRRNYHKIKNTAKKVAYQREHQINQRVSSSLKHVQLTRPAVWDEEHRVVLGPALQ